MPVIFQGQPGRVVAIKDPAVPANMRPLVQPDPSITIEEEKSIITAVSVNQQTNHQFLHTLGNDIFIYVFGDRIGQIVLSGYSFVNVSENPMDCEGGQQPGAELMLNWYKRNKLSSRKEPIKVALGAVTFTAFVTGLATQVQDPKTFLTGYNLAMAIIPEKDDSTPAGETTPFLETLPGGSTTDNLQNVLDASPDVLEVP